MTYWMPQYRVPRSLVDCWWTPFQVAGCKVVFDNKANGIWNSALPLPVPRSSNDYGGTISKSAIEADILFEWQMEDNQAKCVLFPVSGDIAGIHLMLTASGARRTFPSPYGSDVLFLFDKEPLSNVVEDTIGRGVRVIFQDVLQMRGGITTKARREPPSEIEVLWGRAIDSVDRQMLWFIALEMPVRESPLLGGYQNKVNLRDVMEGIERAGGRRVNNV